MMKATMTAGDGRKILLLGLSHANLDRLRADGMSGFIEIKGKDMGIPIDVVITAGVNEAEMAAAMAAFVGPDTDVRMDEKLKQ
jgi:hypothetical protein